MLQDVLDEAGFCGAVHGDVQEEGQQGGGVGLGQEDQPEPPLHRLAEEGREVALQGLH